MYLEKLLNVLNCVHFNISIKGYECKGSINKDILLGLDDFTAELGTVVKDH